MPKSLLESDFLTVDLRSIYSKQTNTTVTNGNKEAREVQQNKIISDWGKELKDRLSANKALSKEAQVSEYEIKNKFFTEYFNANFKCAEQLLHMGQALRVILEKLGFNKRINPILGFISIPYVQENLISTNLLNANTFKAIYNAVAKKLIADSEFFKYHDYNIIYCPDLYRRSAKEIEEYLNLQKSNLDVAANSYSIEDQIKNKKIFFYIPRVKESDINKRVAEISKLPSGTRLPIASSAKLNSLGLAQKINGKSYTPTESSTQTTTQSTTKFVSKLQSEYEIFAALQVLSMTQANEKASKALAADSFKDLDAGNIAKATAAIAARNIMPKSTLDKSEVDDLVDDLLKRLKQLK